MITAQLAPSLQLLIDRRLDNIERALLFTNTPRLDRRQIISAVEDQILEMLSRMDQSEPTRDDVLGILASLDPPEAYSELGETTSTDLHHACSSRNAAQQSIGPQSGANVGALNPLAIIGLVLTSLVVLLSFGWIFLGYIGLALLPMLVIPATVCGIVSLCQIIASRGKQRGQWMSIIACSSLPISMIISTFLYVVLVSIND